MIRELLGELRRRGLPSPEANVVVQVGEDGDDLVVRLRYRRLVLRTAVTAFTLATEHRFVGGRRATPPGRAWWVASVVMDSLCQARTEWLSRGRVWPSGWPVVEMAEVVESLETERQAMAVLCRTS